MKTFSLALAALLWSLSTACAQAPGPQDSERRERIMKLEAEIHEMEAALKRDDVPDERRVELKKRLDQKRGHLKELLAGHKERRDDHKGDLHEKMRRLEMQIHETESALQKKEMGPEDRRELHSRLRHLRTELEELRGMAGRQDPVTRRHGPFGPPGPPPDSELHKLHMEAQELDRASMDLAGKLRSLPPDKKEDRDAAVSRLRETVSRLFDVREKARAREIEMLKKRLEELTQMLDKRKENRDAIIEKRIKQLTGEADPLDW